MICCFRGVGAGPGGHGRRRIHHVEMRFRIGAHDLRYRQGRLEKRKMLLACLLQLLVRLIAACKCQEFINQNGLPVTGLYFPGPVAPFQLIDDHRFATHPARQINHRLGAVNLFGGPAKRQPAIHHLRNMDHLMRKHLTCITNPGSCRNRHLEAARGNGAQARTPRHQHGARYRHTHSRARQINKDLHALALAWREQPV